MTEGRSHLERSENKTLVCKPCPKPLETTKPLRLSANFRPARDREAVEGIHKSTFSKLPFRPPSPELPDPRSGDRVLEGPLQSPPTRRGPPL
eukprot:8447822-Heterocapsa_arctica.AAC.1